ncbi:MAG: hypothetical protein ACI93R_004172 [Flavobacteriales bacterium]|jgi:hypothetical protein
MLHALDVCDGYIGIAVNLVNMCFSACSKSAVLNYITP